RSENGTHSILSEKVHSQIDTHRDYGGVVPELAAREHLRNLPLLTSAAMKEAGASFQDLDLIAVTTGPGLKGSLLSGMLFASGLATANCLPLIPVNHIEAHVLSVLLENPKLPFPFLSLVVSGGHTELQHVKGIGNYTLLARTTDDAAGEAFDKSAKLLDLPYPGGPALAKLADAFSGQSRFELPRVMLKQPGFSFSGLKTAIALLIRNQESLLQDLQLLQEVSHSIQAGIVEVLVRKVKRAIRHTGCNTLAVCGGVSANEHLRKALREIPDVQCHFPAHRHCMDNGTMIALTGYLRTVNILPQAPFEATPRWPIETHSDIGAV
ncbi:MAG: tRNA (adenosine(37)-N6)-threonylcarbamoyltransferase complex transferase subunit TsaD, partial [Bdellovibrionales bacterium]|nr:tRNA (adenosine(37)-N6)-threonylcarbamoyltransferase complex transferase subunit TsaD [Bdellovibrionales bacterium]